MPRQSSPTWLPRLVTLLLLIGALSLRQSSVLSAWHLNLRGSELLRQQVKGWLAAGASRSDQGEASKLPGCDRSETSKRGDTVKDSSGTRFRRFDLLARFLCGTSYEALKDDAMTLQAENPQDSTAAWLLAKSAYADGYFAEARQILRSTSLAESTLAFSLAEAAYANHDPGRAADILDQFDSWKGEPVIATRARFYDLACAAYRDAGRLDDSVEGCRKLVAAAPESSASWAQLANAYLHAGRAAEAIAAGRKALELEPDSAGLRLALGVYYQNAGMTAEADASYEAAIREEPDNVPAQLLLAASLLNQNRCQQAQVILNKIVTPTADALDQIAALRAKIKAHCDSQPIQPGGN